MQEPAYTSYPVNLDEFSKNLIVNGSTGGKSVDVNVNLFRTKVSIMNETSLPLTIYQIKKIKKARKENKTAIKLKLSAKQLKYLKSGGFLPTLLATAPAIAALGSLASNVYNSYQNKKANDKLVEERIRHNRVLEGHGLYMNKKPKALGGSVRKKKGRGLYMNKKPKVLGGSVRKKKGRGRGLYMNKKPKALGGSVRKKNSGNALLKELLLKKKKSLR